MISNWQHSTLSVVQLYCVASVQCNLLGHSKIMSLQFEIVKDPWLLSSDRKVFYFYESQNLEQVGDVIVAFRGKVNFDILNKNRLNA